MITLDQASRIVDGALADARASNLAPMTGAVLDARGCVVALKMEDGSSGVLIRDRNGSVVGACGASGDVADNDEACVVAGIQTVGLAADPGTPQ